MNKKLLFFLFALFNLNLIYAQVWHTSTTSQLSLIDNISVVDDNVIWIKDQSYDNNGVSISNDGGLTWVHKDFPAFFIDNSFGLGILSAVDADTAYIIVSQASDLNLIGLYKTIDAGTTWVRESSIFTSSSFPDQVHFWDANHGFAMGDGLEVYAYVDGVWYDRTSNLPATSAVWSLNSSDYLRIVGQSAYFLTNKGTIFKSADMGYNWTDLTTPYSYFGNLSFDFKDDLNGILVFNDNTTNEIYSTIDGGQSWNLIGSDVPNLYNKVKYIPSLDKYLSGSYGSTNNGLSYSADGLSWVIDAEFNALYQGSVKEIDFLPNGRIFVGGNPNVYYRESATCTIPDPNFEQALIDLGIDSDNTINGQVLISDINGVTNLPVSGYAINDLTGIQSFANLESLDCSNNQITTLNLSTNAALTSFIGNDNLLESLNFKNGNYLNVTLFDTTNNPNLTCVEVDNITYSATNWTNIDNQTNYRYDCSLPSTLIPDPNFEQALIDLGIDSDNTINGQVLISDISGVTDLNVSGYAINDLTGIQDFNDLILLDCSGNQLSLIDVSKNLNLKDLFVGWNNLSDLNVANNSKLESLYCAGNQLINLDVTNNIFLTALYCNENNLTNIDLINNSKLTYLECLDNNLTSLDIANNTLLTQLNVGLNMLTELDLSNITLLESFICEVNNLVSIDVSKNNNLNIFDCNDNKLTYLNIRNGNNSIFHHFKATNNPNLTCIQVDDASYSTTNWTNIDAQTSFSEDCTIGDVPQIERDALSALYNATDGASWTNNTNWNTSKLVSNWYGVTVENIDGQNHVTKVVLGNNNLNGVLPLKIGNLLELRQLSLSVNNLTGEVPHEIGNLTKLENLSFYVNNLTGTIPSEIGNCSNIQILDLSVNNLTGNIPVSFSNLTSITHFWVDGNQLEGQIPNFFSNWMNLQYFSIGDFNGSGSYNQFTGVLDLSNNIALKGCWVDNNLLSAMKIDNGNNVNIPSSYYFNTLNNPNLTCIQVDDDAYSTANWTNIDTQTSFSKDCGLVTSIPDSNFEQALIALGIDSDTTINGHVFTHDISGVTNLDVSGKNISSIVGIEDFTSLEYFSCYNNQITSIDMSQNPALVQLKCNNNLLESLNISQNANLSLLWCFSNSISSLDLSTNLSLIELQCGGNNLSDLDITLNTNLAIFNCHDNQLSSLDVTHNTALTSLGCSNNQITDLDVSQNTLLYTLLCSYNQINNLDVSSNTKLEVLVCRYNNINSLDVTQNIALKQFLAESNNLINLNIKNGNNILLTNFNATNNPNLTCIQVDSAAYSTANWSNIDAQTSFSEDCSGVWEVYIPDTNLSSSLITSYLNEIDTSGDGKITYEEAAAYTGVLDLSNQGITDVTGLQAFTNVTEINLSGNNITDLSVLFESNALILSKQASSFKTVASGQLTGLSVLDCSFNDLTSLDVSTVNTLTSLNCSNNQLTYLNVKNGNNAILTSFNATNNSLGCINVDNATDANAGSGSYSTWSKDSGATYSESCSTLGVEENKLAKSIIIYPNPADDILNIDSKVILTKIELYSILGKRILETKGTAKINISHLEHGLYLLKLYSEKASTIKKVVVE